MPKIIEASLIAHKKKFGIVAGRFNDFITKHLISSAMDALIRSGAEDSDITITMVPGAFEIPLIAKKMAESKKYDAIICLGVIIKGETHHFEYVCAEVSKGIASVGLKTTIPTIFGILTTETIEQAISRSGTKSGNKGWSSAMAAVEMANLMESVNQVNL